MKATRRTPKGARMQRAIVYFRFVYEGGEVYMEKQDGEWTVVSGRLTWIE